MDDAQLGCVCIGRINNMRGAGVRENRGGNGTGEGNGRSEGIGKRREGEVR